MLFVNATIQGKLGEASWGKNVVTGSDTNSLSKTPSGLSKMTSNNLKKVAMTHSKLARGIAPQNMAATIATTARMGKEATPAQIETGMGKNLAVTV